MNGSSANCPSWLAQKILRVGGSVSFHQYMDWALNDTDHGAYSKGHLKIGKKGDFSTSPSLGVDFAELLAVQLIDWLKELQLKNIYNLPLSLVELGPGEGDLSFQLIRALSEIDSSIILNLEIVLVEINEGMIHRQKERLRSIKNVPIRWTSLDALVENPVIGILIGNEILDALPVERVVLRDKKLFRQGVAIKYKRSKPIIDFVDLLLPSYLEDSLLEIKDLIGVDIPPLGAPEGWCSEIHIELNPWLKKASKTLIYGSMLIIDYALEASRYYSPSRSFGTLMSYRKQAANTHVLLEPGYRDITSHLCIDTLKHYAEQNSWVFLGEVRQGQALLALGLAERLHSLQRLPNSQLGVALSKRESLLRLVDPAGLGEFRWIAFEINNKLKNNDSIHGASSKIFSNAPLIV